MFSTGITWIYKQYKTPVNHSIMTSYKVIKLILLKLYNLNQKDFSIKFILKRNFKQNVAVQTYNIQNGFHFISYIKQSVCKCIGLFKASDIQKRKQCYNLDE